MAAAPGTFRALKGSLVLSGCWRILSLFNICGKVVIYPGVVSKRMHEERRRPLQILGTGPPENSPGPRRRSILSVTIYCLIGASGGGKYLLLPEILRVQLLQQRIAGPGTKALLRRNTLTYRQSNRPGIVRKLDPLIQQERVVQFTEDPGESFRPF